MNGIVQQLEVLTHAVRALQASGLVVLEARASNYPHLLPLVQITGMPPSGLYNSGQIEHESDPSGTTYTATSDQLGVCLTWECRSVATRG